MQPPDRCGGLKTATLRTMSILISFLAISRDSSREIARPMAACYGLRAARGREAELISASAHQRCKVGRLSACLCRALEGHLQTA